MSGVSCSRVFGMKIRALIRVSSSGPMLAILDQSVISLGNFLVTVIPSKILDGREFGVYVVSLTAILIFTGVTRSLVTNPFRVLGVDLHNDELDAYVSDQILYSIIISSFLAILISLGIPFVFDATSGEAIAAGLAFFCFQIQDLSRGVRSAEFKWRVLLISDSLLHACRIIGLVALWQSGVMSCQNALLLYAVTPLISISLTRYPMRVRDFDYHRFLKAANRSWSYGRWLLGETLVSSISTQFYVFLVGVFLNTTLAGIYGALQQLVNIINVFNIAIADYITPNLRLKLNNGNYPAWRKLLYTAASVLLGFTVVVLLPLSIFSCDVIGFVYNPEWTQYY